MIRKIADVNAVEDVRLIIMCMVTLGLNEVSARLPLMSIREKAEAFEEEKEDPEKHSDVVNKRHEVLKC